MMFIITTVLFAALVAVHVNTLVALARRSTIWFAAFAFIVPPLAPIFAWRQGMKIRAVLWAALAVMYLLARLIS